MTGLMWSLKKAIQTEPSLWKCLVASLAICCVVSICCRDLSAQESPIAPLQADANVSPPKSSTPDVRALLRSGHTVTGSSTKRLFVTPDAKFAAAWVSDNQWFSLHLWDLTTRRKVAEISSTDLPALERKSNEFHRFAVTSNGRFLLCRADEETYLFDVYSHRFIARYPGIFDSEASTRTCTVTPFSRDGSQFWLADERNLYLHSTEGRASKTISLASYPQRSNVWNAEFSIDGRHLLAEGNDAVWLINVETGAILSSFPQASLPYQSRAFAADGSRFVLIENAGHDRSEHPRHGATVFSTSGQQLVHVGVNEEVNSSSSPVLAILSDRGSRLFVAIRDRKAEGQIFDVDTGRVVAQTAAGSLCGDFEDDDRFVLARSGERMVKVKGEFPNSQGEYDSRVHCYNIETWDTKNGRLVESEQIDESGRRYANRWEKLVVRNVGDQRNFIAVTDGTGCYFSSFEIADSNTTLSFFVGAEEVIHASIDHQDLLLVGQYGTYNQDVGEAFKSQATVLNLQSGVPIYQHSPADFNWLSTKGLSLSHDGTQLFVPRPVESQYNEYGHTVEIKQRRATLVDLQTKQSVHCNIDDEQIIAARYLVEEKQWLVIAIDPPSNTHKPVSFSAMRLDLNGDPKSRTQVKSEAGPIQQLAVSASGEYVVATNDYHPNAAGTDDLTVQVWELDKWTKPLKKFRLSEYGGVGRPHIPVFCADETFWLTGNQSYSRIDLPSGTESYSRGGIPKSDWLEIDSKSNVALFVPGWGSGTPRGVGIWELATKSVRKFIAHEPAQRAWLSRDGKVVLVACSDGWLEFRDAISLELRGRLFIASGREDFWLVVTPEGLFDGSYAARQDISFRVGEGLNVVPVDRFFQDFYYPGLLAAIWRGERPKPSVQLGEQLPPLLTIDSPQRDGDVEINRVTLTVTAKDQGGGIKGPSIRHNGATLIGAVQTTERTDDGVQRTFSIDLIEGENVIEAVSASADGSFESEPARVILSYNKPLPKSRLHLLVVGIDGYTDESLKMKYAVGDANAIAQLFAARGGSLYEDVNVMALRNEAATHQSILQAIRELATVAKPQDTAVVFLSGHGSMVDQNFYFLPQDFRRASTILEEDIRRSGLAATDVGDLLAQVPALKRMVVFDTGQSGRALPVLKSTRNPFAFRGAIERLSRAQGAFTIASAAVSDEATEVSELGHGVLSYSFLAGLKAVDSGPLVDQWVQPSENDKVAQALDLFSFTSSHARRLGKRYFGQEQEVQYSSSGMTFPVLPVDTRLKTAIAANPPSIIQSPKPQFSPDPSNANTSESALTTLHVVTIGINEYAQSSMNLRYAAPDAEAIAQLLASRGEQLFEQVKMTTLLNQAATREGILDALRAVGDVAKPTDTLAIFFAGHGAMVGQRYYFVPHEFNNTEGNMADDALRSQGLAADEIGDEIAKISALKRLVVFDTCASGGAIRLNNQGADPFAFRGAIDQLGKEGGTFTLAAVSSDAEAQEIKELGHGILSYCLLAGAGAIDKGPLLDRSLQSASGDGADVLEWFSYAAGNVPRISRQYSGKEQQVQLGGTGKAFPVLRVMPLPTDKAMEK